MAAASHTKAEAASGHTPLATGSGIICQSIHARPTWMRGNTAAVHMAHSVMSSARRAMLFLHRLPVSSSMADMSVPACPKPIQNTNSTISHPQGTLLLTPKTPTPSVAMRTALHPNPHAASAAHSNTAAARG